MDRNTNRDHPPIAAQSGRSRQGWSLLKRIIHFLAPIGSKRFAFGQRVLEHLRPYRRLNRQYQQWIAQTNTPNELELNDIRAQIKSMTPKPLISVIMPVYNPDLAFFREAVDSVFQQAYDRWELCIADDASSNPEVRKIIQDYAAQDDRVKFVFREQNGHISAASNSALDLASGDFIALLDHDDKLHPLALYHAALTLIAHPDCEMIYSDEDKITRTGKRVDPYFKTDFDEELLLNHNYLIHLGVYRHTTVKSLGGFRVGFEGSQDYDLNLRVMDAVDPRHIYHLPQVLYHWRISITSAAGNVHIKPYAADAAVRALNAHFERKGVDAAAVVDPDFALYQPQYRVPDPLPSVDLVMFTRGLSEQTVRGIDSLLANTVYVNFRLIVAMGKPAVETADKPFAGHWADDPRVSVQSYVNEDHRASVINRCGHDSNADYLCLVDENLRWYKPGWLAKLVGQAAQPGIGSAGAKLVRSDGKIYSCGIVLGLQDFAVHLFRNLAVVDPGYRYWAVLQKGNSALSSACLLLRREHFLAAGGFDERLIGVEEADVDFCLRLREKGLRHILVPAVVLETDAPAERLNLPCAVEPSILLDEQEVVKMRWQQWMMHDPSFNPHLSQDENGRITLNLAPHR